MKSLLFVCLITLTLFTSCKIAQVDSYDWGDHLGNSVQIGLNIVSVDIADTQDLRMTGLSDHE